MNKSALVLLLAEAYICCNGDPSDVMDASTDTEWPGPGSGMCDGVDVMQLLADGGVSDAPTGIERCPQDIVHRYDDPACIAEPEIQCSSEEGCGNVDGDCPPGEACTDNIVGDGCDCITPCMSDDDCDPGEICLCPFEALAASELFHFSNGVRQCVPASCRTDADCGAYRCGIEIGECGGFEAHCHTELDECEGTNMCDGTELEPPRCDYDEESARWACDQFATCE